MKTGQAFTMLSEYCLKHPGYEFAIIHGIHWWHKENMLPVSNGIRIRIKMWKHGTTEEITCDYVVGRDEIRQSRVETAVLLEHAQTSCAMKILAKLGVT